jgi:hypothetical protein
MATRQARRRQQRVAQARGKPGRRSKTPWYLSGYGLGGAIAAIVIIVIIFVSVGNSTKAKAELFNPQPAPASVLNPVTNTPQSTIAAVGSAGLPNAWTAISGRVLTSGGKPQLLYDGAEYCPYCAAQRWPMVNALSRFGHFSGLQLMKSESTDVLPSTNTFTFRNATYASPYISFVSIENTDNVGKPLQSPTGAQTAIINKYNAGGGIPFIDLANRATAGVGYNPGVLHTNPGDAHSKALSWQAIANYLTVPTTSQAKGIIGNANWLTAGICKVTENKPASACSLPIIRHLESQVGFTR